MKTIETIDDIKLLVDSFYLKVQNDPYIGFFFNEIAQVQWEKHLPKMYKFWETLLFGTVSYKGNPMLVHFPINNIEPITEKHFEQWLLLWTSTVNENFHGEIADLAIYKAQNISKLMSLKMSNARKQNS